jgi:hypothetical protein
VLAAELGDQGIRAYNLDPRVVATKLNLIAMADHGIDSSVGASPDVIGEVVIDLLRRLDVGESGGAPLPGNWGTVHAQPGTGTGPGTGPGTGGCQQVTRDSSSSVRWLCSFKDCSAEVSSQWKTRAADA